MKGRSQFERIGVAIAVPVAALAAVIIVLHGGGKPGVTSFNACLSQKHFLVATNRKVDGQVIDTITDRAQGTVVGEFAVLPALRAPESFTKAIPRDGTVESSGRMVLFTKVPTGRDTHAILTCGLSEFPITP